MIEEKKVIWKEDIIKQMKILMAGRSRCGRDKRDAGQASRRSRHRNSFIKDTKRRKSSSSKGKREVLLEH